MSRKNVKFINAKCPRSLLFHSGGLRHILSLLPRTASSVAPQSCQHETRRHSLESRGLTRTLTPWRLHLEDTSAPLTLPHTSVFSITRLSISVSHARTEPTVWADWQEVQTVRHHRLHFRCVTGNREFTDGWLLAGKTCFIYHPEGRHLLSYGYDMDNFEVYLDFWCKTLKILTKKT